MSKDSIVPPPCYADLGKNARDLSGKGYNYGTYKLESKTKSTEQVEFKANALSNHDSGKFKGCLETKYFCKDTGITFLEKWDTDNTLATEISMEDQLTKGLKLVFEGRFAPSTGKKSGNVSAAYKREYFNGKVDVDFDFAGPTINAAAVTGYKGWLAGYQMAFDTSKNKLAKNNFTIGYQGLDFELNTSVNDGSDFSGSVFHKVNALTEAGVELQWTAGSNATKFGIAFKHTPNRHTIYRAKVNNASQVGLSHQQVIRPGITLTTSALFEGKNLNAGGHKVGLGLEFAA